MTIMFLKVAKVCHSASNVKNPISLLNFQSFGNNWIVFTQGSVPTFTLSLFWGNTKFTTYPDPLGTSYF